MVALNETKSVSWALISGSGVGDALFQRTFLSFPTFVIGKSVFLDAETVILTVTKAEIMFLAVRITILPTEYYKGGEALKSINFVLETVKMIKNFIEKIDFIKNPYFRACSSTIRYVLVNKNLS